MIRVALADDHAIVREGFRSLIGREPDMQVVLECATAEEVETALAIGSVDVLVLDISMRDDSGLAALPRLRERYPCLHILIMSMHDSDTYVSEAFARGADGYVSKAVAPEELIAGIRAVFAGKRRHLGSDLVLRDRARARAPLDSLTIREREVFLGLAGGAAPKQVAATLGISVKTAYVHRANVLAKLGARNDRELYRIALEHGLLGESA